MSPEPLIKVEGLQKWFPVSKGLFQRARDFIHAVDGVSFDIMPGQSMGLVGESGCGKTTTGKLLVRLLDPTMGKIYFKMQEEERATEGLHLEDGYVDVATLKGKALKHFRRYVQMIFQDPYESMNPRLTIYDIVAEPMAVQGLGSVAEREERVATMLQHVGLTPPESFLFRYPHELSGGQRQRIAIARALIINPIFVVADEPTSMLDVSVRTGVMQLMQDLAREFNISYLYITHDLAVARYMCNKIAVMYLGKIVEMAETEELLHNPLHPYTKALLSAVPIPDPTYKREVIEIRGSVSTPINPPPRCRFYNRCPIAKVGVCDVQDHPPLEDKGGGHYVACYLV
jgi:oligopeptide/dipeptide ABC transporter, ATP-binding protein, C-terminal domain